MGAEKHMMASDDDVYLNGTNKISLSDIEMIPKLHLIEIISANALNINIANKSKYAHIAKYISMFYEKEIWQQNNFANEDAFDIWRTKFGVNSFDSKYKANEQESKEELKDDNKEDANEQNVGFYSPIQNKQELYHYLCAAMCLELSTIPLYLCTLYSFKPDLSETAKAAKKLVREVVMEEMLHMNLISNIISSIYGVDKITTKFNIPYGKGCKLPANIRDDLCDISLKPFCKEAIFNAFIQIEAPSSLIQEHQPIKSDDGSIQYPFEPNDGQNSVDITFHKKDDVNQIGEFYKVIQNGLKTVSDISFTADDKMHKQRKCKSRKSETQSIESLEDALEAIDLICTQGEGYELKEGVFGAVCKNDDGNLDNDLETKASEKTHFIKFIECLVGRELKSLKIIEENEEIATYKFTFEQDKDGGAYNVDFENEIYPISNFEKPADSEMFDDHYAEMLEKLTSGLKKAEIGDSVKAMHGLRDRFKECMDKKVYPQFVCADFPLPPLVGGITSKKTQ